MFYKNSSLASRFAPIRRRCCRGGSRRCEQRFTVFPRINGVVIDVMNPFGADLTAEVSRSRGGGRARQRSGRRAAAAVAGRPTRRRRGGSDRVTLVWKDYQQGSGRRPGVANGWLEVTVRGANLRLAEPHVLRVGNLIGEAVVGGGVGLGVSG